MVYAYICDSLWYLYQSGEKHGNQKRWATDFILNKHTYRLDWVIKDPGNCVLCYLQGGSMSYSTCRIESYSRGYSSTSWMSKQMELIKYNFYGPFGLKKTMSLLGVQNI